MKQNLLDLGIDYYAASRIVDGVALMADLSIWRGGSGNTKLKLHLHLPTFLYTTKHKHKHKFINITKRTTYVGPGPELN